MAGGGWSDGGADVEHSACLLAVLALLLLSTLSSSSGGASRLHYATLLDPVPSGCWCLPPRLEPAQPYLRLIRAKLLRCPVSPNLNQYFCRFGKHLKCGHGCIGRQQHINCESDICSIRQKCTIHLYIRVLQHNRSYTLFAYSICQLVV
jgi:hypothetical protein